jgi:ubiquinone/menaquinone biosynthesis C-methylase UbiE
MDNLKLLIDLHKNANRQGPGGEKETEKAIVLAMLDKTKQLKIADIGCGTGASAILLAKQLNAQVTAVDFLPDFIDVLKENVIKEGIGNKIHPLVCSMEDLPFNNEEYDVIWSEGAIYNMGFEHGIKEWRRFLKPGGMLVVSEITWSTNSRPYELQAHWEKEYPEIDTASSKFSVLESNGYSPVAYFLLPEHCWLDNYYRPMQNIFADFLKRNSNSKESQAIVSAEETEIALYEKYKSYYSYGVYIARKLGS